MKSSDNNGISHAFTLVRGSLNSLDFPGAFRTRAIRVNDAGQIIGDYFLAGQHGCLPTPNPIQKP